MTQLDDLVGAIRAADGDDPELADATQLRVRRSLEARARSRHRVVGVMTTVGILFAGTAAWALATGQVSALWTPAPVLDAPAPVAPPPAEPRRISASAAAPARPAIVIQPVEAALAAPPLPEAPVDVAPVAPPPPLVAPITSAPPAPARVTAPAAPAPAAADSDTPAEPLYRAAHQLHFHGGDPIITLRAWDAYLAAEPRGRFAVEARYNRALTLIRLRRYDEARAQLLPFASGAVEPAGYRQTEAGELIERLAHLE